MPYLDPSLYTPEQKAEAEYWGDSFVGFMAPVHSDPELVDKAESAAANLDPMYGNPWVHEVPVVEAPSTIPDPFDFDEFSEPVPLLPAADGNQQVGGFTIPDIPGLPGGGITIDPQIPGLPLTPGDVWDELAPLVPGVAETVDPFLPGDQTPGAMPGWEEDPGGAGWLPPNPLPADVPSPDNLPIGPLLPGGEWEYGGPSLTIPAPERPDWKGDSGPDLNPLDNLFGGDNSMLLLLLLMGDD